MILIGSTAEVYGNAKVCDNAVAGSYAKVYDNAKLCGDAEVYFANVYGNAQVGGRAHVQDNAQICGDTIIEGVVVIRRSILEGDVTISEGRIWDIHWWRDLP